MAMFRQNIFRTLPAGANVTVFVETLEAGGALGGLAGAGSSARAPLQIIPDTNAETMP
jgi:hypothetical protein